MSFWGDHYKKVRVDLWKLEHPHGAAILDDFRGVAGKGGPLGCHFG